MELPFSLVLIIEVHGNIEGKRNFKLLCDFKEKITLLGEKISEQNSKAF
jgi:hypothetical protein